MGSFLNLPFSIAPASRVLNQLAILLQETNLYRQCQGMVYDFIFAIPARKGYWRGRAPTPRPLVCLHTAASGGLFHAQLLQQLRFVCQCYAIPFVPSCGEPRTWRELAGALSRVDKFAMTCVKKNARSHNQVGPDIFCYFLNVGTAVYLSKVIFRT